MDIGGYQITDAVPLNDGSGYMTSLVDSDGQVVATVTRTDDGAANAQLLDYSSDPGTDWTSIFSKVTGFLDNVAKNAQQISNDATRVANAAKGAVTGAQIGYNGPIDWKPWLYAGGVVVGVLALNAAVGGSSRRRRRR